MVVAAMLSVAEVLSSSKQPVSVMVKAKATEYNIFFFILIIFFNFQSPLSVRVINLHWCSVGFGQRLESLCSALGVDLTKSPCHFALHVLEVA